MKKLMIITMLLVVAAAAPAFSGGQGSVKIPFDPDVGWAVINTAGSGKLIAVAQVQDGLPNEEFSVSLRVRYEDGTTDIFQDIATLTTNGQGKGHAQVQVDINPAASDTTLRRVAVRVRRAPQPLYVAVGWDIPLK